MRTFTLNLVFLTAFFMMASMTLGGVYYQDITDVGTSAGTIGIGGIQGFSDQASVLFENPAALGNAQNSMSAFYTSYFDESRYFTSAFSFRLTPALSFGIGAAYQQSANLDHTATNNTGIITQSYFNGDNLQLTAGLAYQLWSQLRIGVSWTEYLNNSFDVHGSGGDLGVGMYYNTDLGDLSLSGKNVLGNSIDYQDHTKESLASQWTLGFKSVPMKILSAECFGQLKKVANINSPLYPIGLRIYPQKSIALQVGYKEKPGIDSSRGTFTAGLILKLASLQLEYGYDTTEVYQNSNQHYVSLAYKY